jgi:hypothetical protein
MATQRWFYGCSVRSTVSKRLLFAPAPVLKGRFTAFGNRVHGIFTDAHLAKN